MSRVVRAGVLFALAALLAAASAAAATTRAGHARCEAGWTVLASPPVANGELLGVAPRSADDVWAVGAIPSPFASPGKPRRPLIEHWNGSRWTVVPGPRVQGDLLDVTAAAANDAWAVGAAGTGAALIEHWDGSSWRRSSAPWPVTLAGVAHTSAGDVWAVGRNDAGAAVLHWDGTRWSRVVRRAGAELADVVALGPSDVWAVGSQGERRLLAMHWDGARWHVYLRAAPGGEDLPVGLDGVAALSSTDVRAAGGGHEQGASGFDSVPVVIHWDGRRWADETGRVRTGAARIAAIAARPPDEVWVTGTDAGAFALAGGAGSFLGRWHAGAWAITALPKGRLLRALAADPAGTLWAVGLTGRGSGANGFPARTTPLVERHGC